MLSGLIEKILRETWLTIVLTCVALAAAMALFVQILPQFEEGLNEILLSVPFVRTLISGLLGMDVSEGIAPRMILVVVWSHPIVLATVWGFVVVTGTRFPAAEIEHGTIDVLLGWPVSRRAAYASEILVGVGALVAILASAFAGYMISGATLAPELQPDVRITLMTITNLFALLVAVSGIVHSVSAACDRRGKAMGISVAILLASYLTSFLSTLWPPAEHVAFASFVSYYQPAQVMLSGEFPLHDVAVLLLWGAILWTVGAVTWIRRSVRTI